MTQQTYIYRALDKQGKTVKGRIEAGSQVEALRLINGQGMTPLDASLESAAKSSAQATSRRVRNAEAIQLLQELATLLEAGVPLGEALPSLAEAYRESALHVPLQGMHKAVRSGAGLGAAMREAALPLPGYVLALIGAGEASGQMAATLHDAARQMEFEATVRQEAKNALIYPAILVISGILAILIVFIAVVPRFASLLKGARATDLPEISRIVIQTGIYAKEHLLMLGLLGVALALLAGFIFSQASIRRQLLDALAQWPLTRGWIVPAEIGRWANLLGTLLGNRVALIDALTLSRDLLKLPFLQRHLDEALREVRHGRALSDIFSAQGWLGPTQANLIRVGERSGELPRMLISLGQQQTNAARQRIKRLLALLEPIAILVIGIVIGFIMVAVMLAITSLNTAKL